MALPSRPTCTVLVPADVFVGEPARLQVVLTCDRETRFDEVTVHLRGRQGWSVGTGKSRVSATRDIPDLAYRLLEEGVLGPGEHRFWLPFTLPSNAAPSHELRPAYARLLVSVHASIPWWPDGRYEFVVPVRDPPPPTVARTPIVTREPFHAEGNEPRIELSLGSTTVVAGETLVGSIAVFHLSDSKPREVSLDFDSHLALYGRWRALQRWGPSYQSKITIPAGSAGQSIPFRITVPAAMTPCFATENHQVTWILTAKTGALFEPTLKLSVPLTVVDACAASSVMPLTIAPRVADERAVATFARVSVAVGMTVVEPDPSTPDEHPVLERAVGPSVVRLGYAYRGTDGTFLVGRISYPSLGLDLQVAPSSPLREAVSRDLEVDIASWDRHHRVHARVAEQAVPFLRATIPTAASGTLVRWTDEELVTERAIGALDDREVADMANALIALAEVLRAAATAIPPPPGLAVDLDAWTSLAARVQGVLTVGDLSVEGTLDAQPISLGLVFDERGAPVAMRVTVGSESPVDTLELNERATSLLGELARDLPDARLTHGAATASIPIARGGCEVARVREVATRLRAVIAALVDAQGPYR